MNQPNVVAFANGFAQNGVLTMDNILPEDMALSVQNSFNDLNWVLQVKDYSQTKRLEVPLIDIKNRSNLIDVLYDRKHDIDLDNLFYIRLAVPEEQFTEGPLAQVKDFLNSENFINSCRSIVGMEDINRVWLEATCYDKGCFLGNHRDDHHPDNRVAIVLNLTRTWKIDWGGLLLLEAVQGQQPILIPPRWNSLSLFRIPVNHSVTSVTQAATEHRYSITGWLRP